MNDTNEPGIQLCPRCGTTAHQRKPDALRRTLALSIAAAALFIPANTLPILSVGLLSSPEPSTILGGVIDLYELGSWPLALIVFVASFVIPMAKLIALWVLLSHSYNPSSPPVKLTKLYWLTEWIGRWSMVDIFVVAILYALVQFGSLASVEVGPAAWCFGATVILTMAAAESFDPRIMWDKYREQNNVE
ncbi:MAG: paraquat-inducible protein A [Gammaproteobacteria bacterium]|nr:paraquat-inducible protein A [Gammaproteobacteria bacterium]